MYANANSKDGSGVHGRPPEQLNCLRAWTRHRVPGQVRHFYGLFHIRNIFLKHSRPVKMGSLINTLKFDQCILIMGQYWPLMINVMN